MYISGMLSGLSSNIAGHEERILKDYCTVLRKWKVCNLHSIVIVHELFFPYLYHVCFRLILLVDYREEFPTEGFNEMTKDEMEKKTGTI